METGTLVLAIAGWLALSLPPLWLGRRARSPAGGDVLFRIAMRPWLGLLVRLVPFLLGCLALLFGAALFRLGGWDASAPGTAIGLLVGLAGGIPFLALAWAWTRTVGAGCSVSPEGIHLMGSLIRWSDLELTISGAGWSVRSRASRFGGRGVLRPSAWDLDPATLERIQEMARAAGHGRHTIPPANME